MFKPGTLIAQKYRLERILGRGAVGTVWRAVQVELDRPVALKLLHHEVEEEDDEAQVRFSREARVAASLDHPSTVAVLDFGEDQGSLYLVMELVDGETLRARLQRDPPDLTAGLAITRQVATALAAAHRIRLVHRDIKPENVILPRGFPPPPAKVVDFGLAFIVDPEDPTRVGRVTLDGSVAGTPAYMSPEQVRGGSIGPASDIYSLGCMLYELVAGRPPFTGAVGEIMTRQAYAPPIALRELDLPASVPVEIDELVQGMLSKSPSSRPTASRVVGLLAKYETPEERVGRTSSPVIERSARAVPRAEIPEQDNTSFDLGVIGAVPEEVALAFETSGIRLHRWDNDIGPEGIVWAAGCSPDMLAGLVAAGKAVVTDVAPGDATSLPALIRAGVADAVVRPHVADDLVRRVWRVHRLRART